MGGLRVFARIGGAGPGLLLLHGFPQTHLMWRDIAPALSGRYSVVCADLRGYGETDKPASSADHAPYAKRAMAADMASLMSVLGFARFAVAGHDRGGRVAYRLALDHPDRVSALAVLDVVPTGEVFARADKRLALAFWPFSLLAQPEPLPERLIGAAPEAVVDDAASQWGSDPAAFSADARTAYVAQLRDPETVHAICEEYRAAATLDVEHDEADRRAGRRIACPTLAIWARGGALDQWYDDAGGPLEIWRAWAADVRGEAVEGGHFFPEQAPHATAERLAAFLSAA